MARWPFKRMLRPGATRPDDAERREEIELYLELRTEELMREGHARDEARRIAEERFGDVARIEDQMRREGRRGREEGTAMMETVGQDVAYALRTFRRNPLFFVVATLTLALAVAGNTAIFSVLDAAVLRALPFPDADRLVFINGYHLADGERAIRMASVPEFHDWRERSRTISPMVGVDANGLTLSGDGEAERIIGELVSRGYFEMLDGEAVLGRTFTAEEAETPDGYPLMVVSDGLWRRRFGADPALVGRTIQVNDRPVTVLGVMPPGFRGINDDVDAWLPMGMMSLVASADMLESRGSRFLGVVGRLAAGADTTRAQAELDAIARDLQGEYPDSQQDRWAEVQTFRDGFLGGTARLLWILVGAGILLLLIAAANVANLLLVRAHARSRELVVRRAVGADGSRVARQLLTESLVLAGVGGVVGLGLAWVAVRAVVPLIPVGVLPDFVTPGLSVRVFLFSASVVGLAGIIAGTVPAASGARTDLAGALRSGGRGVSGRRATAQQAFVIVQVGLALLLLVGAGLLTRSFRAQLAIDPGLDMRGVSVFRVQPPQERYPDRASILRFTRELVQRVEAVPGVSSVAASSDFPFRGRSSGAILARPDDPQQRIRYHRHSVTPGYFENLGIRLLRGRTLEEQDAADAAGVVVVTQAFVDRVFPDDPNGVGRRIAIGNPADPANIAEIVGVVDNVRYRNLTQDMMDGPNSPDVFFSIEQMPSRALEVSFRAEADLASVLPGIRRAVAEVDPAMPLFAVESLEHAYEGLTATPRFAAFLMGLFSLMALVLAGVGIYGVLAFSVGQRTPEIALRRALGAGAGEVAGSVVIGALRLTLVGLVLGVAGAYYGTRALQALLFHVQPTDPGTFGGVSAAMLLVAALAAAVPAWRATRRSPAEALNAE